MNDKAVMSELAPTGRLRVGVMYTNPVLTALDPVTGKITGVAVDIAEELARRLGVPMDLVGYENTAGMLQGLARGEWDVASSGYDTRRTELVFAAPYIESDGVFVVRGDSVLHKAEEVDRPGIRVAVSGSSSLDLHLTRSLKHASLERIPGAVGAGELFMAGKVEVLANVRQQAVRIAARVPGARILDGRFMVIQQAFGVPAGRAASARYLRGFIEDIKASGLVAKLMAQNGVVGAWVSAAAPV